VLVKGIEPATAAEVIDLPAHLERGSGRAIPLEVLRSDFELMPVPDREPEELPAPVAATPDPRGPGGTSGRWSTTRRAAAPQADPGGDPQRLPSDDEDEWPEIDGGAEDARFDASALPTIFVGATLAKRARPEGGLAGDGGRPGLELRHLASRAGVPVLPGRGVFQAGFQEYDSRLVYVHIKELQRFKYRGRTRCRGSICG
jgi:lipoprotein-releasing system permease protein